MIRFVITPGHEETFDALLNPEKRVRAMPVEVWTYPDLFAARSVPRGTWVFSDLERLAVWELRLAGEMARLMRVAGGFRLLNDPSRAAARYELLLRLHRQGFNRFRAWRAEDGVPDARFPVFLRLESNHRWPISGLIHGPAELERIMESLVRRGLARRGVIIVEYEAEPLPSGVFRKYGAYRFGDRIVADHLVHDLTWLAKYGKVEAWTDQMYVEEAAYVRDNPHAAALMRAFEIGGIDYGRADYGLVDGALQIWEINTNPHLPAGNVEKSPPQRAEATLAALDRRVAAIEALDSPDGPPLPIRSEVFEDHYKRQDRSHRDTVRE